VLFMRIMDEHQGSAQMLASEMRCGTFTISATKSAVDMRV